MNDTILNAGLLALMIAIGAAACASSEPAGRRKSAAATADMPVVMLPAVQVAGKRQAPADTLASASPALQVVQLPRVEVSGRRVPTMDTVTLARAQ